jgi:hypothetical protein
MLSGPIDGECHAASNVASLDDHKSIVCTSHEPPTINFQLHLVTEPIGRRCFLWPSPPVDLARSDRRVVEVLRAYRAPYRFARFLRNSTGSGSLIWRSGNDRIDDGRRTRFTTETQLRTARTETFTFVRGAERIGGCWRIGVAELFWYRYGVMTKGVPQTTWNFTASRRKARGTWSPRARHHRNLTLCSRSDEDSAAFGRRSFRTAPAGAGRSG